MFAVRLITVIAAAFCLISACERDAPNAQEIEATPEAAYLIIRFHVREDRIADFLPIMEGVETGMSGEEGFITATVYRDVDSPLSFTLVEAWATRALHEAHFDRINAAGDWASILEMLTEQPDMSYNETL